MRRSQRRLLAMLATVPLILVVFAVLYMLGMEHLEGQERGFGEAFEWAAETLTTTGYGRDARWDHPLMIALVVFVQFAGVFLVFLVFPVFLIPFIEERFEARLPRGFPDLGGHVLIYRWGPAVASLLDELERASIPVVVFEEDEVVARRLHEQGHQIVLGNMEEVDPVFHGIDQARGVVANGSDHDNAVLTLSARAQGFSGPIIALVATPNRRRALQHVGATAVFTPTHAVAAAMAAQASVKLSPRVSGAQRISEHLDVAEIRIHDGSPLDGKSLVEAGVRARTGATIIAEWLDGELVTQPAPDEPLRTGAILVAVGSEDSIEKLAELATPVRRTGPFVIVGYDAVGEKVRQLLTDVGEAVVVVAAQPGDEVDHVGDPLDPALIAAAGAASAQAVIVALPHDNETLFAVSVVRDAAPRVPIIASVNRATSAARVRRAGADFVLSVDQVASQLLAYQLMGEESVALQPTIKLVKTRAGSLAETPLSSARVRERTGCSIVAVERGGRVIVEFDPAFRFHAGDAIYVTGTPETIETYFEVFPETRGNLPRSA